MSRPLRLELAGGLYHVTSRGDRREDIYVDDAKLGMAAAYATGGYTLQAIADAFGVRYCTVSHAVSGT